MTRVSITPLGSALLVAVVGMGVAALAGAAGGKHAKDEAAPKAAAEGYEGFEGDRALLRKHLIHKAKDGGKDTRASSAEACEAAHRVFSRVPFLYRTRDEVLGLLGDPATISDYNEPAGEDPTGPLVYVFDTGRGGYKYTISFGELSGRVRATAVRVEGQD